MLTSLNCRKITAKCLNIYSFSPPNLSYSSECRDNCTIVYVSKVLLQKVNIYHALFILLLEQSTTVTVALTEKKTLHNF